MYREGSENPVKTEHMSEKRKERLTRAKPWILEDDNKSVLLKGQLEGGFKQNAPVVTENARQLANVDRPRYFIFVKEGDYFSVIAIEDWYKFYPFNPHLQQMTLEEAEVKLAEIRKKEDTGEPTPKASRVKKEKADDENKNVDFDKFHAFGDIVEDEDNDRELERDAEEKGEEFDFNNRFDDDQKEDVVAIKEEEREQNQFELTDAGKELKKLVRGLDNTLFESDDDESSDDSFEDSDDSNEKKQKSAKKDDKTDKTPAKVKSEPSSDNIPEKEQATTPAPSAKKRKHEDESPTANKKAKTSSSADKELEDEMRQYLLVRGKIPLLELVKKFKTALSKSKDQFAAAVKKVANSSKEDGETYVTLKETK
eukprot:TRINITY_DN2727_c0_g1_i1.p1 TRINITY_DN2727_c0_g1~~TRINITY_DN2727_c0_g1_i1.p1  ORF type:complete len:416 (-),score=118.20 TRINITY_DN2727_c0_g1_i1:44-1147(-)